MPRPNVPPMVDRDYTDCNAALKDIAARLAELEVALAGGAPCQDKINEFKQLQQDYSTWKAAYWPDRP